MPVLLLLVGLVAQHPLTPVRAPSQSPAATRGAAGPFEDVSAQAAAARDAGRLAAAARLYRQAVTLRPDWAEGWWYLGSLAYEADRHPECREAFFHLLELDPVIGPAWALRGLCEFSLGEHARARSSLDRALEIGPVDEEPLWGVVLYHLAILSLRNEEFERAIDPLRQLAATPDPSPDLVTACGLLLLRLPALPQDVPPARRELVRLAGRAQCASLGDRRSEARQAFEALLARYPKERHVHHGLGVLLARAGSPEAIDAFRRETELHPDHVRAHVELAFNLIRHGRAEEAVAPAETAARLDPEGFVPHLALGRALAATGDLALGLFELETAARLGPGSPEVFFALARAYTRAGRQAEADRANARFLELDRMRSSGEDPE